MTFYNVISGILFMGACQAVMRLAGTSAMWYAVTLLTIMCNEAVLTSEILEGKNAADYTLKMKIVDLLTFFVLSYALLVVSPNKNTFGDDLAQVSGANSPGAFFGALTFYWVLTLMWNNLAGQTKAERFTDSRFVWIVRFMGLPFFLLMLFYRNADSFNSISRFPGVLMASAVVAYMVAKVKFFKPQQA